MIRSVAMMVVGVACATAWTAFAPADGDAVPGPKTAAATLFDRHVAPLFIEHCIDCHRGPRAKGGLDLSTAKSARTGGDNGPALVPGRPNDSLLWKRVRAGEMPPKHALAAAERQHLKSWIEAGAPWGKEPLDPFRVSTSKRAGFDWWALQKVQRPAVPTVKLITWPRNPIDTFILARLEARGLAPSPETDPRTLLRRLYFDLLGLPPNAEAVTEFVAAWDGPPAQRQAALERVVEGLLASPHYGERWARHWLDVVRFGESDGFERNGPRLNAWPYRDWVVQAFNADMPYDEFCRLQIAGDVLKPGDVQAMRATGFLVAGIHNTVLPMLESARQAAFQDELEDLVGSVGQTFLGLTVNCGRCHDHKFDPISQKDYYRLASALSGVRHGERELISTTAQAELTRLQTEAKQLRQRLSDLEEPARRKALAASGAPVRAGPAPLAAWNFRQGGKDLVGGLHVQTLGGARFTSEGLLVDGKDAFGRSEPIPRDLTAKTLEVWVRLDNLEQRGGGVMTIQSPDGAVFDSIVFGEQEPRRWLAGSDFFRRTVTLRGADEVDATRQPVHIALVYHSDGTIGGFRNGKPYGQAYKSSGPVRFESGRAVVVFGLRHAPTGGNRMLKGTIVEARLYDRALTAEEIAVSATAQRLVSEADLTAQLSPQAVQLRRTLQNRLGELSRAEAQQQRLLNQSKVKLYAALSAQPAPTRLLNRGQVSDPGETLAPGGVAALTQIADDFGLKPEAPEAERRAKLADWLTHPRNPLFARVMVNRLWHYHFGTGIVETPNDFGFNGGRPSHPELLDWLAAEFAAHNYRLKHLHRLIVTSSTYRQASTPRQDGLAVDADTRLHWRKKPVRLDAETLRDSMLQVAGLLNRELGGRGFSDYRETGGAGTQYYDPIDPVGPAFHRRSLYRFNPRGHNLGLLDAFDCPDPASAAPRRGVTTTPLQALALWNGPFALRMAETLAQRLETAAPRDLDLQVTLAYQQTLQRHPLTTERDLARRLVERHSLRALARALFNSNEFLIVD